ncbi:hypothetical protein PLEOSDRAFT_1103977 [Pleurotus ostreatus PC15]|uniref:Uncharacterized protein n=1 Tax=Pleurotus ostreatus (strain PC15) TaxID=1137138 RepID=A0A067NT67_PLEO1|nr:hypothetical protein PLEOSDRAFT_1103977 [Pleurotus ostreatus PC15]
MPDRRGSLRVVRAGTSGAMVGHLTSRKSLIIDHADLTSLFVVKNPTYVTGWTFSLDLGEISESSMFLHAELKLSLYSSARSGLRPRPKYYGMFLLRIDSWFHAPGGSHVSNVFLTGANLPAYTVTSTPPYHHYQSSMCNIKTPYRSAQLHTVPMSGLACDLCEHQSSSNSPNVAPKIPSSLVPPPTSKNQSPRLENPHGPLRQFPRPYDLYRVSSP